MTASELYARCLPDIPKAPEVPKPNEGLEDHLITELVTNYIDAFDTYLHRWDECNNKVVGHFAARCSIYAIKDSGNPWHLNPADRKVYLDRSLQDIDVLRNWSNEHKAHIQRLAEFKEFKKKSELKKKKSEFKEHMAKTTVG
ncbi:hypothetical protein FOMG_19498 [Fusarium oxysporum f. sp. melonis 26406]|uniref:Uncharacterized protein n=1 Tax=Fusarium oxysporum f. sp. melonis 26406 TaxID=1089452 RepID=W9ZRJ4_FUSOX|nr:hypothetical protein FOMG_19498 [Fusarium oxysporum f. sp. melonis 26406]